MNRHFVNYAALPCAPLGEPKVAEKQQASDGEWKPLRPGYESRTLAGGATEVRSTPDSLEEMVTRPDESPASQSREPAYQPEGFDFAYVDRKGRQDEAIPKRTELDPGRVMPEDVHGSRLADVPEGATHRCCIYGTFYRHIKTGETYTWGPNGWQEAYCRWSDETMAGSGFERLPQPAAPTEWQSGPPPEKGWYVTCQSGGIEYASHWDGDQWTPDRRVGGGAENALSAFRDGHDRQRDEWRGPRLVGADWPEPQQ